MRMMTALATVACLATPLMAEEQRPMITVTGEGSVEVAPDMATISLGVMVNGETAKAALDANSAALAVVIERLKAAGIADKDIQTSNLSLGPVYDYSSSGGAQNVTGYSASNMVTVRVRDIGSVGAVLDASVTDGANTLNGITFGLQEPAPRLDEARAEAVTEARRKAELFAAAAGVSLGPVISISESGGYMPPIPMAGMAFEKSDSVPVQAGQLAITAAVSVTYALGE
ncbi:MAG: SIMPL domain-containing protein [Paracoccaceae bacterium]